MASRRLRECVRGHEQVLCPAQALYQKQGRSRQFGSKEDRDAHIGDEVRQLERAAAVKRSSADDLRSHVQQLTSQLMDLSQVCQNGAHARRRPFLFIDRTSMVLLQ